jgi:hypothetical protein
VDRIDRLGGDVPTAERLERGGALEEEQLVLLDDGGRKIVRSEDLVARDPEPLAQPDEEERVGRRLTADRVLAAFLDDERDGGPLAFEILEGRREASDGDDLSRPRAAACPGRSTPAV